MKELLKCDWVSRAWNLLISGPTGTGKSWIGCCLGMAAVRRDCKVKYYSIEDLLYELVLARTDGIFLKRKKILAKLDILIIDDFGLSPLNQQGKSDLKEIIDDRTGRSSTILIGQRPYTEWHGYIDDPMIADAIMDRLSHNRFHLKLTGPSRRHVEAKLW